MGMRVQDGAFKMQTGDKRIKPGKEVTVSYHNMPNAWLLNNYGACEGVGVVSCAWATVAGLTPRRT